MPYTLHYSDPNKTGTITVPDMPPGINAVDTSLNLVGRGYPNYGQKFAENFLHLLENFASPFPGPVQPIEGQLWYDTTDPYNKVLRVRDGTYWANASGIYQQGDDPRTSNSNPASLKAGDIWVDTANSQLKIYNSGGWTVVGPMRTTGSVTGIENDILEDNQPDSNLTYPVIKVWADGDVLAVITSKSFTPKIGITGFPTLVPGINLRNSGVGPTIATPIFNGVATAARNLEVNGIQHSSSKFLRIDDSSNRGQVITGSVFFKTPTDTIGSGNAGFGQGRDGIVINNESSSIDAKYIQFYKGDNDAIILNNHQDASIFLKVNNGSQTLVSAVEVNASGVTISTPVTIDGLTTINGNQLITGTLSITSSTSISSTLSVVSTATFSGSTVVGNKLYVNNLGASGSAILPGTPSVVNTSTDIGSASAVFRTVYAREIGSAFTGTTVYGKVVGSATHLEFGGEFKLEGQVTAPSFVFNGQTGTTTTFNASLAPSAISAQTEVFTATNSHNILVLNTSTNELAKINRTNFIGSIYTTGMIIPFGTQDLAKIPQGWLLCDGSPYNTADYQDLYSVIGSSYGGGGLVFNVPEYVTQDLASHNIYHIIKT